jgi:hypothetical protein
VKLPYKAHSAEPIVTNACFSIPHPERQSELELLRKQNPNMIFEEKEDKPLPAGAKRRGLNGSGDEAVDAAVAKANSATPDGGCGPKIIARPATP